MSAPQPSMLRIANARAVHAVASWRGIPFTPDSMGPHRLQTHEAFLEVSSEQARRMNEPPSAETSAMSAQLLLAGRDLPDGEVIQLHAQAGGRGWAHQNPDSLKLLIAGLVGAGRGRLAMSFAHLPYAAEVVVAESAAVMGDHWILDQAVQHGVRAARFEAAYRAVGAVMVNRRPIAEMLAVVDTVNRSLDPSTRRSLLRHAAQKAYAISPGDPSDWRAIVEEHRQAAVAALVDQLYFGNPSASTRWMIEHAPLTTAELGEVLQRVREHGTAGAEFVEEILEARKLGESLVACEPGMSMP